MNIAILGTRGVPARYGGFETLAEQLGQRLAARGHQVTVYGRKGLVDSVPESQKTSYRGMQVVVLPTIRRKHMETVFHTLVSAIHAASSGYDAVLLCNAANVPWIRILHAAGIPVALNVDGLERKRRKWGIAGRTYYRLCESLAAVLPDALITDAEVIQHYYQHRYGVPSQMITYGGDLEPPRSNDRLQQMNLEPGQYLLYVSRFEPENNPDRVVEAFRRVATDLPLVMVGGAPYSPGLVSKVRELADDRVLLPGPIYGEGYRQLLFNCRAYIHATEVGGTHPALVEAMGAGRPVLYYDTPENREVAGPAGLSFVFSRPEEANPCPDRVELLETILQELVRDSDRLAELAARSRQRVAERYRWDQVADAYESLLAELC